MRQKEKNSYFSERVYYLYETRIEVAKEACDKSTNIAIRRYEDLHYFAI